MKIDFLESALLNALNLENKRYSTNELIYDHYQCIKFCLDKISDFNLTVVYELLVSYACDSSQILRLVDDMNMYNNRMVNYLFFNLK